jgi:peptidoglycan hydrolase-like protein with peptidoglycan-binding domain
MIEDTSSASKLAVIIVDACRNDPLASTLTRSLQRSLGTSRSTDVVGKGLARPGIVPPQTLIAYATASGSVAYDGDGRNSPYVSALLRYLKTPQLEVRLLFGKVRDDVARQTRDGQWPDIYNSLGGDEIYLVPGAPVTATLELSQLTPGERRAIQQSLGWLGFWYGAVDGQYSPALVAAVRNFQGTQGAEDTGALTPAQAVALHRLASLRRPPEKLPAFELIDVLRRSETGDAQAQLVMAMIFDPTFEPGGLTKDRSEAVRRYERLASQGNRTAAARLGLLLGAPGSPAEDQAAARKWLEQAAKAGEPQASLRLAELLLDLPGNPTARDRALGLLKVAAVGPDTGGIAAARLRLLGAPVVQQ